MEMTPDMLKKAIKCGIIKIEDLDESEIMRLIDEEVKSMGVIIPEITIKTDKGKTRYVCNIPREYSIDGKRHQVSASTREKCEEKFKKEILRLSKEKKRIEEEKAKGDKTVDELFDEWFVFRRGAVKGATLTMNRVLYDKHIKNSDFGKIKIKEISLIECEEFLKTLYHKNLAVGSVKLIKSMISTAFDYAVAHDYIEKNYMRYSKINANLCTGIYHSECNAWTDDEIRQLWDESERLWKEKECFDILPC